MPRISENIKSVQTRLTKASLECQPPLLLAVSKTRPAADIREAAACGLTHFGENYVQEGLEKIVELKDLELIWHFIGSIQSNKTALVAENFAWVHTLDRAKIARRLSEQRPDSLPDLNVLVQINIDKEDSKAGVSLEEIEALAQLVEELPRLKLRGLMAIPRPRTEYEDQFQICRQVKSAFDTLKQQHAEIDTLSLGMSADLEAAVAAGSNLVRIGTDIFGARPQKAQ